MGWQPVSLSIASSTLDNLYKWDNLENLDNFDNRDNLDNLYNLDKGTHLGCGAQLCYLEREFSYSCELN